MSRRKYRYKERSEYEAELSKVELQLLVAQWIASHRIEKKSPKVSVRKGSYKLEVWEGRGFDYAQLTYDNKTNERPSVLFVEFDSWLHSQREHYKSTSFPSKDDKDAVAMYELFLEVERRRFELHAS